MYVHMYVHMMNIHTSYIHIYIWTYIIIGNYRQLYKPWQFSLRKPHFGVLGGYVVLPPGQCMLFPLIG